MKSETNSKIVCYSERRIFASACIMVLLLVGMTGCASALWTNDTVNPAVGEYGRTSLALDSAGLPQIAFTKGPYGIGASPEYAKKGAAGWTLETLPYTGQIEDSSLDLDSHDTPHISFYDHATPYFLGYAVKGTSGWQVTRVDTEPLPNDGWIGEFDSIKIDSHDNPHISYEANGINNQDLKHATLSGDTWSYQYMEDYGVVGSYTSIALDSQDLPHVSHAGFGYNGDYTSNYLLYSTLGSGSEIADMKSGGKFSLNGYAYTSLALDSHDHPHISYLEGVYDDVSHISYWYLKYATKDSAGWHVEYIDASTTIHGPTSIAVDSQGDPFIAFYDAGQGTINVAKKSGGTWDISVVDEGSVQGMCSLVLSGDGTPHVSYVKDNQLKYAYDLFSPPPRVEATSILIHAVAGGTATAGSGGIYTKHSIFIPAGSLGQDTIIEIRQPDEDHGLKSAVDFGPGTTFSSPATITVEYKDSDIPQGQGENAIRLLVWDGAGWIEVPGSVVHTQENVVSGPVSHLSTYGAGITGPVTVPEFPSGFLPVMIIAGFLGVMLLIQRRS